MNSAEATTCAHCGAGIPLGAPHGQCPRCLLGFGTAAPASLFACPGGKDGVAGRLFGDYELIEEIARGGMGVVYRARQRSLDREVALKMILAGELADEDSLRLFRREAQAAANLHHPNIVPVHEIGEHELQHYFTMRLVPGGRNIADWAATERGQWQAIARAVAQAARAVAHAHAHGVLHRDLKPSNILWDDHAGPQVTDFGLAKLLDDADGGLTLSSRILGSPNYMAPEQAGGRPEEITTSTDVYGLGAVLYELLAGRPPFTGSSAVETMRRALEDAPASLPDVPNDLRIVCLKCLAKKPSDRYATAAALAEDLERFACGEPVTAVPLSPLQTAWRWAQRRPQIAGLLALTTVSLLAGVLGILWQWRTAEIARRGESRALRQATETVVDLYTHSGINAAQSSDPTRAALWFAQAAVAAQDAARQAEELGRQMAWRLGVPTCVRAFESGIGPVGQIRWNVNQTALIAQARRQRQSAVWVVGPEQRWEPSSWETMELAAWANQTNWIAYSTGERLIVAQFPSARELARLDTEGPITALAISRDDRWIAVGSRAPFLWEPASARKTLLPASLGPLSGFDFSRNGRYVLLTGGTRRGVCALDSPREFLTPPIDAHALDAVGFLGHGEAFFSTTPRGVLTVFETASGEPLESYATSTFTNEAVNAVSPDGRFLARHSQPMLARSGEDLPFPRHKNRFEAVDFSRDGQWLLSGGFDAALRLWAVDGKGPGRQIGWHQQGVTAVAFAPDQRHIASAQSEGSIIRIWRLADEIPWRAVPLDRNSEISLSPDGKLFVPNGWSGDVESLRRTRVYDTEEARPVGPEIDPGGAIMDAGFAPDGSWLALLCLTEVERGGDGSTPGAGNLQFWDYRRGRRLGEPIALGAEPRGLGVHPTGRWIGLYDAQARLSELDVASRAVQPLAVQEASPRERAFGCCRYSPDGSLLVGWGLNLPAIFWDRRDGKLRQPAVPSATRVMDVTFFGNVVATAPLEARVDFLSVPELTPVCPPVQDSDWLFVGRFSEDGSRYISGGRGSLARIWDWRQGRLQCPALPHENEVFGAAFIPGTDWVATGDISQQIRFWNQLTGLPIRPPLAQECNVMRLFATPDGRSLLRANFHGDGIRLYRLADLFPPVTLPPEDALLLAEIDASAKVLQGGLEPLTAAAWMERWRAFRARRPDWHRW